MTSWYDITNSKYQKLSPILHFKHFECILDDRCYILMCRAVNNLIQQVQRGGATAALIWELRYNEPRKQPRKLFLDEVDAWKMFKIININNSPFLTANRSLFITIFVMMMSQVSFVTYYVDSVLLVNHFNWESIFRRKILLPFVTFIFFQF